VQGDDVAVKSGTALHRRHACDEAFLPYRHLAIQVIDRALRDVTGSAGSVTDFESARLFFDDSAMLFHWCRVAALDPHWMAERAAKLTAQR
jgi:hypothetical protein